jgi:IMP dehydrogenase
MEGQRPMRHDDMPMALTYDDVLLVPQRSSVNSRKDVDTSGNITPTIALKLPIVSANMDTVTEWRMAIAVARAGGIGIIHRFLSIEEQAAQVRRVKRSESFVIESPYTIGVDATVDDVYDEMAELGVHGLPVVDDSGVLVGLVTRRDLVAATAGEGIAASTVRDAMTPRDQLVVGAADETLENARAAMASRRVEKLPLVDDAGKLVGLITMKDIEAQDLFPNATKDARGRLRVGAAIGVRGDYLDRARACADAGADLLCLDIAHGHSEAALRAVSELRKAVDIELVAGNVATAEGARDLIEAGAHSIKVGVGPGSVCTTRLVAGVGVPQLSAVLACADVCADAGVPLCADGGIRMPADVSKAIAAGGHTVMVGNLLAGTTESPGTLLKRDGRTLKVHRGMASRDAMDRRDQMEPGDARRHVRVYSVPTGAASEAGEFGQAVPEGVEAVVPYRGDAANVLRELTGGLRSAMSYSNSHTIGEFHERAQFVRITAAGQVESRPHDVEV